MSTCVTEHLTHLEITKGQMAYALQRKNFSRVPWKREFKDPDMAARFPVQKNLHSKDVFTEASDLLAYKLISLIHRGKFKLEKPIQIGGDEATLLEHAIRRKCWPQLQWLVAKGAHKLESASLLPAQKESLQNHEIPWDALQVILETDFVKGDDIMRELGPEWIVHVLKSMCPSVGLQLLVKLNGSTSALSLGDEGATEQAHNAILNNFKDMFTGKFLSSFKKWFSTLEPMTHYSRHYPREQLAQNGGLIVLVDTCIMNNIRLCLADKMFALKDPVRAKKLMTLGHHSKCVITAALANNQPGAIHHMISLGVKQTWLMNSALEWALSKATQQVNPFVAAGLKLLYEGVSPDSETQILVMSMFAKRMTIPSECGKTWNEVMMDIFEKGATPNIKMLDLAVRNAIPLQIIERILREGIYPTPEILNYCLTEANEKTRPSLLKLLQHLARTPVYLKNCLTAPGFIIALNKQNKSWVEMFTQNNFIPTVQCLLEAKTEFMLEEVIAYTLDKGVTPNVELLEKVVTNRLSIKMLRRILEAQIYPTPEILNYCLKESNGNDRLNEFLECFAANESVLPKSLSSSGFVIALEKHNSFWTEIFVKHNVKASTSCIIAMIKDSWCREYLQRVNIIGRTADDDLILSECLKQNQIDMFLNLWLTGMQDGAETLKILNSMKIENKKLAAIRAHRKEYYSAKDAAVTARSKLNSAIRDRDAVAERASTVHFEISNQIQEEMHQAQETISSIRRWGNDKIRQHISDLEYEYSIRSRAWHSSGW